MSEFLPPRPRPAVQGLARQRWRDWLLQGLTLAALLALVLYLVVTTATNLKLKGVASGFDFLWQPAGFAIGEGLLFFEASDSYFWAFAQGLGNTLRVSLLGIVCTALLGSALGMARLSHNLLLRGLSTAYVEIFRNIPLLLQLLTWYFLITSLLPTLDQAWQLGHVYLSKGGLAVPWPLFENGGWLLSVPERNAYTIAGGARLTPEFLALLLGLVVYTSAYLAETIRSGLESVPHGQREAAAALGLSPRQIMRRVVLPQAMRVILPPATSQFLNLSKNASLAIVIGYPDLVAVANTSLNQTGRTVECISLIMLTYLVLSLATSAWMNRLNRRHQLQER